MSFDSELLFADTPVSRDRQERGQHVSSGAGLQWREEISALLRVKDPLRDLPAGHAGLGHADQVVEVKTLGRGEPDKILYRGRE